MEMVLPASYVAIEEEEMMYLEGGYYMNNSQVRSIIHAFGFSGALNVATVVGAVKLNSVWMGALFGTQFGPIGTMSGAALGTWMVSQAAVVGSNLVTAYSRGKGVKWGLGWSWAVVPGLTGTVK